MHGITFGRGLFETTAGRVEPDSDVHFGLLLIAAASEREGASREEICTLLWPDASPEQARHSLRQALYRLRRLAVPIHLRGTRVSLNGEDTHVDLRRLFQGSAQREELLAIGTLPFLPGYTPKLGPRFAAWLEALRDRANSVRRFALVEAIRDARAQARFREIHKLARALLTLDPLNETATLSLAEALVMDGSKVEALRMLDAYEEEVGLISESLRIPVRTLRRRVSECLDDALLPRRYEVPFVGREAEFTELRTMFVATRQGKGQCAVVTGEAGIGKTRITSELLRLAVLDGAMAVTYSCTSGDALSPLSSLLTLTQALLAQPGALGCSQEHLQYLRRLNAPESSPPIAVSGMGADIAYAQLVYALSELVAAIADEGPLVVFVDDAQRLHQTSWRIFTDLVDRLPDRRVLLVFATRQLPEWYASLGITGSDGRSRHVRLKPLPYAESRSYLTAWSEKHGIALSEQDRHQFSLTAEGNPFYLGELAGHVGRGGDARQAPASIRGLIELQYAATTKKAQRLLLVVSLLQARASIDRVTDVLGASPSDFVSALEELELDGLVAASGSQLRVKHEMVADVTVGLTTPGVVAYLRRRIATLLEAEAEIADSVELLNDSLTQWERVGDAAQVFSVGIRVGHRFQQLGLGSDAHAAYTRAGIGAGTEAEQRLVLEGQMKAAFLGANTERTLSHFEAWRHLTLCKASSKSDAPEYELLAAESEVASAATKPRYERLLALASEGRLDVKHRLRALAICAMVSDQYYDRGPIQHVESILGRLDEVPNDSVYGIHAGLVCSLSISRIDAIHSEAARLLDVSRKQDDLRIRMTVPRWVSSVMQRTGAPEARLALIDESMNLAVRYKLQHHQAACLDHLCDAYLHLGLLEEATDALLRLEALCLSDPLRYATLVQPNKAWLAYLSADKKVGASLLVAFEQPSPFELTIAKHEWLSCRTALRLLTGSSIPEEDLSSLVEMHKLGRGFGGQDQRLVILCRALRASNRAETAKELADSYLAYRREATDLPFELGHPS